MFWIETWASKLSIFSVEGLRIRIASVLLFFKFDFTHHKFHNLQFWFLELTCQICWGVEFDHITKPSLSLRPNNWNVFSSSVEVSHTVATFCFWPIRLFFSKLAYFTWKFLVYRFFSVSRLMMILNYCLHIWTHRRGEIMQCTRRRDVNARCRYIQI